MIFDDTPKPSFKKIVEDTSLLLLSSNVANEFPFSIKKLVKEKTNIKCISYSKASDYGTDISQFGSDDAVLFSKNGKEIIFYNDDITSAGRKKFSISHELGHKFEKHDPSNQSLYDLYEVEANFFAAQLLMPEQVINELARRGKEINVANLVKWFGVSGAAARKRIDTLSKLDFSMRSTEEKEMDELVISKYSHFIDSIAPLNYGHRSYYLEDEEEMQRERDSWFSRR